MKVAIQTSGREFLTFCQILRQRGQVKKARTNPDGSLVLPCSLVGDVELVEYPDEEAPCFWHTFYDATEEGKGLLRGHWMNAPFGETGGYYLIYKRGTSKEDYLKAWEIHVAVLSTRSRFRY